MDEKGNRQPERGAWSKEGVGGIWAGRVFSTPQKRLRPLRDLIIKKCFHESDYNICSSLIFGVVILLFKHAEASMFP